MPNALDPTSHRSPGRRELKPLTGVRGLAACYVVFYHLHNYDSVVWVPRQFLKHGYLSVDVFFVLSGFVMAMSYGRMFASGVTPRSYAAFLLRRLARVYPLYIFVLCLAAIAFLFLLQRHLHPSGALRIFVLNAVMLQGWGLGYSIIGPSWSVSTEVAAYLLFPVLLAVLVRPKMPIWLPAAFCIGIVIGAALQPTPASVTFPRQGPLDVYWSASAWPVIRCVAEFSLGLLAFRFAESNLRAPATDWFVWTVSAGLIALLFVPDTDVFFVAAVPLLMIALLVESHPVNRFLGSRPVMALGHWSYAIYLWHTLLVGFSYRVEALTIRHIGRPAAACVGEAAFWIVLLAVAALSFRYVEVPGRRLIRRLEARLFPEEDRRIALSEASEPLVHRSISGPASRPTSFPTRGPTSP